jgi:hypothetical protein
MILNMAPFQTQMSMPSPSQHLYKQNINVKDKKGKIAPLIKHYAITIHGKVEV